MTKKILVIVSLLCFIVSTQAQVDNYALRLGAGGSVDCGTIPELDGLQNYTVQFWLNPNQWTSGATIYSRGEDFKAELAQEKSIVFTIGDKTLSVSSNALVANNWAQVTLVANNEGITAYVDGEECGQTSTSSIIPANSEPFTIGGGLEGRIDEFRLWKAELAPDYDRFCENTLNKHCPQWNDLVAYYKFDQYRCPNVVDYKFAHHGTFSTSEAGREIVTDNDRFRYRIAAAYTEFSRWFDQNIDRDRYLLCNDLIILGINSSNDGHLKISFPYNEMKCQNAQYLSDFEGRKGVMATTGEGVGLNAGPNAFTPGSAYTFYTWIYIDEWKEGGYIFKKESEDGRGGFSLRLGPESGATGQLIARINGYDYQMSYKKNPLKAGEWAHVGISTYVCNKQNPERRYRFIVNGVSSFAVRGLIDDPNDDVIPVGADGVDAVFGVGLSAKFDETLIWHVGGKTESDMQSVMENGLPLPGFRNQLDAGAYNQVNSAWTYDDPENPGYDYFSYKYFVKLMRSAYEGYDGYKIRMSVRSHSGWEDTFANEAKRKILAEDLAEISKEFDGVDMDFEWCYNATCWDNYGKVIEEVKKRLPADKIFTVSPHYVSYALPAKYMDNVDYFTFQIYGPAKENFTMSRFESGYEKFKAQGYPPEKMLPSFATTTSKGYKGGSQVSSTTTKGINNGFLNGDYSPDEDSGVWATDGNTYYFTGFDQTYARAKYAREKNMKGIFYWSMGNDVSTSHQYSLAKAASFGINSNVDTIVTTLSDLPSAIHGPKINSNDNGEQIKFFPNPSKNGTVQITLPNGESPYRIRIFDTTGKCIKYENMNDRALDVSGLKKGIYAVSILTQAGHKFGGRFIKDF